MRSAGSYVFISSSSAPGHPRAVVAACGADAVWVIRTGAAWPSGTTEIGPRRQVCRALRSVGFRVGVDPRRLHEDDEAALLVDGPGRARLGRSYPPWAAVNTSRRKSPFHAQSGNSSSSSPVVSRELAVA